MQVAGQDLEDDTGQVEVQPNNEYVEPEDACHEFKDDDWVFEICGEHNF